MHRRNIAFRKVIGIFVGNVDATPYCSSYPHVQPSKKALHKIKDRVTELTTRRRTIRPLEGVVNEVNTTVRGWVGYFHYRNCCKALGQLSSHVEERLKTHLRKRHKVRNRKASYAKFPSRSLYEKYGLYKVPTSAGWAKVHASR